MVVLANYTFDSTAPGRLPGEGRRPARAPGRASCPRGRSPDLGDPELLQRIQLRYDLAPVAEGRYDDPRLARLLERYRRDSAERRFLLPIGAFRCVRAFEALSGGRLLLLTGDKAVTRDDELAHGRDPSFYVHGGGAFSFLLNLHALGALLRGRGRHRAAGGSPGPATQGRRAPDRLPGHRLG